MVDTFTGTATRRLLREPPRTFSTGSTRAYAIARVSSTRPQCSSPDRDEHAERREHQDRGGGDRGVEVAALELRVDDAAAASASGPRRCPRT